jgi:hypothetical protein
MKMVSSKTTIQNLSWDEKQNGGAKPYTRLAYDIPHSFLIIENQIEFIKRDSIEINCLCYNAAHMQYGPRFANNNNNNDNDDLRIVGRSLAG